MPKISDERREERRGQILDAAVRCFSRSGYHRTSMTDIIAESGLSSGAIYGYFRGKQEIIHAVAHSVMQGRFGELNSLSEDRVLTPAQIASVLIGGLRASLPTTMLVQVWAEATIDAELRAMFQEVAGTVMGQVSGLLERWATEYPERVDGDPAGWARRSTPVFVAVVMGFIVQSTLVDEFDGDAFVAALPGVL
ncbi:TetR/AcrR family transcriptional regulator [Leucobacter tenebrionis]|uniref:TetR/AcrR family transcriptional regulator n=1 Tax=Leucobacter tenebrionis TaxID=2873270 RepID=UPI001CA78582|nr:TetR/AcrR family transcriptional regulator [Leucobacter tenebrionis]QZY52399.1 TetR/AcrR family transcriptional regulator [Leucobacter tenebrionis]